jgi:Fatty acid hydroxylase superfamily
MMRPTRLLLALLPLSATGFSPIQVSLASFRRHGLKHQGYSSSLTAHSTSDPLPQSLASSLLVDKQDSAKAVQVPTTIKEALCVFFLRYAGPPVVVVSLAALTVQRLQSTLGLLDSLAFASAMVFWWFQEHFLHKHVLHSSFDHIGKRIHQDHHNQPYHHVSIEPCWMISTWLATFHVLLRCLLPLPLALTATIGYGLAGLGYMWWHYLVHTRVDFAPTSYADKIKRHHLAHHAVDDRYWYSFSVLAIDDVFKTNPSMIKVKGQKRREREESLAAMTGDKQEK